MSEDGCADIDPVDDHDLWRWACSIMNGDGASTRSATQISPVLHILTEHHEMWCTGGRAMPFVPVRHRYCRTCLGLASDMWDDLHEDEIEPYDCTGCGGTGWIAGEACGECQGTGTVDYTAIEAGRRTG